jgi:uncharacterized SAM-binding protein YcdF (DUF218 family)
MLKKIVVAFVFIGLMLFATTGILIYSEFSGDSPKCEKIQYLIILGAKVRQEGVSPTLQRRLDKTLPVLKNDTNIIVIVSGGKGDDEPISEAKAMSDYLISKGIKASRIISEDQSFSTEENLNNSKKLLLSSSNPIPIYLSTSNYHQYRAQLIAKKAGFEPYGLSSTTPNTELPYRTFREMIAIIVGWI